MGKGLHTPENLRATLLAWTSICRHESSSFHQGPQRCAGYASVLIFSKTVIFETLPQGPKAPATDDSSSSSDYRASPALLKIAAVGGWSPVVCVVGTHGPILAEAKRCQDIPPQSASVIGEKQTVHPRRLENVSEGAHFVSIVCEGRLWPTVPVMVSLKAKHTATNRQSGPLMNDGVPGIRDKAGIAGSVILCDLPLSRPGVEDSTAVVPCPRPRRRVPGCFASD